MRIGLELRRLGRLLVPFTVLALVAVACGPQPAPPAAQGTRVTLIHFADYHSHAIPFYSEGQQNQAGLARTIGYLKQARKATPNAIILNGGDTMNSVTPAWSDKYQCAEWPMFNGMVDALAVGNHEFDYGWDAFGKCRTSARYPVLGANLVTTADQKPVLTVDSKPYLVKTVDGVKVGIFGLGGPDFAKLINKKNLSETVSFADPVATAQQVVSSLRNQERVDVVVFFGHEDRESDIALAKQVSGINLILGSHSHLKADLQKIEGTSTWFISPYQYLTYLSRVELTVSNGKVTGATGKLVKMDASQPEDAETKATVDRMQKELEADPKYAAKFVVIGTAAVELSVDKIDRGESVLGNYVMDSLRRLAKADAAFSTASSFRASIPPGPIRLEDYLTAVPYKNLLLVHELTGAQVQALLDYSVSKIGSDNFSATSGLRYKISGGKPADVQILKDAANESAGFEPLNPTKTYQIATTDFQAKIAAGYKDIFGKAITVRDTGLVVNDAMIDLIKRTSPISAKLDGRVSVQ
jgi:5'-nucleotidase